MVFHIDDTLSNCPWTLINETCPPHYESFDTGTAPSYVAIVSSTFSCLGSLLIILTFFILKDMRTGSQKIITLLALADLISAVGYIIGSSNYLQHHKTLNLTDVNTSTSCKSFSNVCTAQAAVTTWSSNVSFYWTVILAFYFFLIIVFKRIKLASRLMVVYNIIAWLVPLIIVIPLLAYNKLGYAHYAASNWCFVNTKTVVDKMDTLVILAAGKFWEILSYILVTVLYVLIYCAMRKVSSVVIVSE